jgi:hypothetical protein
MTSVGDIVAGEWIDLCGDGRFYIGHDVGTTDKSKSNPSCMVVMEDQGKSASVRLAVRFKSADPQVTVGLISGVAQKLLARQKKIRSVIIDATSERFFASSLKSELRGVCNVQLAILGSKVTLRGESMSLKYRAISTVISELQDNRLALPPADWIFKDLRQIYNHKGSYDADVLVDGGHADFFIALALALDKARHGSGSSGLRFADLKIDLDDEGRDFKNKISI